MTDSGGATFSLMYLPASSLTVPSPVGTIIQLTPTTRAALGLSVSWDTALTMPSTASATGRPETLVLCAVYGLGQQPSLA